MQTVPSGKWTFGELRKGEKPGEENKEESLEE